MLQSRPKTLQSHGEAPRLGGQLGHTFSGTGGQRGARLHQCSRTCPASTHLWLRQTPQSRRLQRTAEDASGCATHTSTTTGRPGRYRRRSPRWGSCWERGGSRVAPMPPSECAAIASPGGCAEIGCGGWGYDGRCSGRCRAGCIDGVGLVRLVRGAPAAEAAPGVAAVDSPTVATAAAVGGAAVVEGTSEWGAWVPRRV